MIRSVDAEAIRMKEHTPKPPFLQVGDSDSNAKNYKTELLCKLPPLVPRLDDHLKAIFQGIALQKDSTGNNAVVVTQGDCRDWRGRMNQAADMLQTSPPGQLKYDCSPL
jgi:hypothetical protein